MAVFCIFMKATLNHCQEEICSILEFYASWNGRCVQTFRDSLSIPS